MRTRPPTHDELMYAIYTCIYHLSMGLSVALVGQMLGYKVAFLYALFIGILMEVRRGR